MSCTRTATHCNLRTLLMTEKKEQKCDVHAAGNSRRRLECGEGRRQCERWRRRLVAAVAGADGRVVCDWGSVASRAAPLPLAAAPRRCAFLSAPAACGGCSLSFPLATQLSPLFSSLYPSTCLPRARLSKTQHYPADGGGGDRGTRLAVFSRPSFLRCGAALKGAPACLLRRQTSK